MSLANIKLNSAQRGFTIVELLIVVVVIAILAAITIVSYNGITTRANASAAKSVAATVQKKVELYQAEEGRYPVGIGDLSANTSKSYHLTNASITPTASPIVTADSGKTRVQVFSCGATAAAAAVAATVTGVRIIYFDYEASTPAPVSTPITLGTCTAQASASWIGAS